MADRYWVGGTASWDGTAGTKWATTSGGAGGASVPTSADDVFFDSVSTGTVTIATGNTGAKSINCTGFAGTITGTASISVAGSVTLSAGMTYTYTGVITLTDTGVLTTNGKVIPGIVRVNTTGSVQLGGALTSSASFILDKGTFDAAGYNVTITAFSSSNADIRTLYMRSGLWTLTGTGTLWLTTTTTNLTIDKGTADILLSDTTATARTISAGGLSLNKLTIGGATGTSITTLSAANFTELASTKTVAHTLRLSTAGNGSTYGVWSIKGTAGNVVTVISGTAGTRRTFNLTNVTATDIDYLAVQDIECLQADRFYVGANSTNNGNNVNVYFTASPSVAVKTIFRSVFRPVFREIFRPIF